MKWFHKGTCFFTQNIRNGNNIQAFDFDDTLVDKNGKPKDDMVNKINELGCEVVIFSNQYGITKKLTTHSHVRKRMTNLAKRLNVKIDFYYAIAKDCYRKPMTSMYKLACEKLKIQSMLLYCGDAMGRKGDFSITDLYFANNTRMKAIQPEEFLGELDDGIHKSKDQYGDINVGDYISKTPIEAYKFLPNKKYVIVIVGSQASGKSYLAGTTFSDFSHVNNDKFGTKKKSDTFFMDSLKQGHNIVVDNTNSTKLIRKFYVTNAIKAGYHVICYYFDLPKKISFHMNMLRCQKDHKGIIPPVAIHKYYKYLENPELSEGYDRIIHVDKIHTTSKRFISYYNYEYDIQMR